MKKLDVLVLMVACVFLLASCSKEADDRTGGAENPGEETKCRNG